LHQALPEKSLSSAAVAANSGGTIDFVEQKSSEASGLTIARRIEWEANPVEDSKLTYSAPGSAVKLTVRKASSAGFLRTNFAHGIGVNNEETSGPFGLSPGLGGAISSAQSQRVDWTLVNLKSFGITAFGYQNEVGRDFRSFGQAKTEFGVAGSSTLRAGSQVRMGAFDFGLAQSSIAKTDGYAGTYFTSSTTDSTVQQEASASVKLAQLVPGGLAPQLLPTVWLTVGTNQAPTSGQASETVTTSFGGTWTWNMGYASLGYSDYSSGKNVGLEATWRGQGFDAHLGAYRSSFGIDVGLSYGQSEQAASSWQSAGALYNSYATVSYKPDKLPSVSLTVAGGNYDHNAITHEASLSEPHAIASNGEYFSLTAGIDLTSLFWGLEEAGGVNKERPSMKMFYRYSDSLFLGGSDNATKDVDGLVAVTIESKF
jgi:hypothetical protein